MGGRVIAGPCPPGELPARVVSGVREVSRWSRTAKHRSRTKPTPEQEDPGGSPPAESPPASTGAWSDGPRRVLVVGGAVAAVGVIAAIAFTVGGDGDLTSPPVSDGGDLGITLPSGDSSTSVAVTAPVTPAPTPAATSAPTPAPTEAPPTTLVPTTPPPTAAPTSAGPTTRRARTTVGPTTVAPTTTPGAARPDDNRPARRRVDRLDRAEHRRVRSPPRHAAGGAGHHRRPAPERRAPRRRPTGTGRHALCDRRAGRTDRAVGTVGA